MYYIIKAMFKQERIGKRQLARHQILIMEDQAMTEHLTKELFQFIKNSPSCYHVIYNMKRIFLDQGFEELHEGRPWSLKKGGRYLVTRNLSSILAFQIPRDPAGGFHIIASHSDSPTFKIKEHGEITCAEKYTKLNVEKYGGMLMAPWFDRPLSVAGRLLIKKEKSIFTKLVHVDRDLLLIPNLAIHMDRNLNEGYKYNPQVDLLPLYGDEHAKDTFMDQIAQAADVPKSDIIGSDLFLYNRMPGTIWGCNHEYISCPKLDDLQCAFASLKGFLASQPESGIGVYCVFDNEEVGSNTKQGAGSTFLKDTLRRICMSLDENEESYHQRIASSFMLSADNAHAVHPNLTDKADLTNRPFMNDGIVIKYNANQRYTTDGVSAAIFKTICEKADVPYQVFANRSDVAGGSTLGNISSTQVPVNTVDIGLAQLAMHSPYETAGTKDTEYLVRAAKTFYESEIRCVEDGSYLV